MRNAVGAMFFGIHFFSLYETESKQNASSGGKRGSVCGEEPSLASKFRAAHAPRLHRLRRIGGAKISRDWQTNSVAAGLSRNKVCRKDESARVFCSRARCEQNLGNARENFPPTPDHPQKKAIYVLVQGVQVENEEKP